MDEIFEQNGVAVRYKLRPAKQDRKHLVVVFAGVQLGQHDFFGFDGTALDHVKGAVLWIKDSFEDHNSYYLCKGLDFKIEKAVAGLIDSILQSLELGPADCTLLGGSKGGSAALHLGMKYDYRNIVASVPQTKIGTYTRQKLKETFAYMGDAGAGADAAEATLNDYIPRLIAEPRSMDKNVYIVSSEADPEFEVHIKPLLNNLSKLTNFNILLSDSMLVTAHPEVTPYNVPFILSTLYALCDGLAPRYGSVENGNGRRDRERLSSNVEAGDFSGAPIAEFHWIQLRANVLNFRAYGVVLGQETLEPPADQPLLVAEAGTERHEFHLESFQDKSLNSKLYRDHYRNYLWAGLKTPSDLGLSLESLPRGVFELKTAFTGPSGPKIASLSGKQTKLISFYAGHVYHLDADPEGTRLTKRSLDGLVPDDGFFEYAHLEVVDSQLFVRGSFAVPREEMRRWNDGDFVLTLDCDLKPVTCPLASSRGRDFTNLPGAFDDQAYAWANFATPSSRGLPLGTLPYGCYEGYVSFVRERRVYKGGKRFVLEITPDGQQLRAPTITLRTTA